MDKQDLPLSPMAVRFCEEMILDSSSQKRAAIRAGYAIESASQEASRLMRDPRVQKLLSEANQKAVEIVGITAARILQELALIAFARPGDVVKVNDEGDPEIDLKGLSKDNASGSEINYSSVSSGGKKSKAISVKTVKPADKIAALTTIAKMSNYFPKQELEVTGKLSLAELVEQSMKTDKEEVVH